MSKLRLGIIGMSEGNGHPYSWSAICNGYDPERMERCPFPVIPRYLERQRYPEDTIAEARVTHIWTQERRLSEDIAAAALISEVVDTPEEMIGSVDAVLLARDDYEQHYRLSKPFLDAGLPVYIDKPISVYRSEAENLYRLEKYRGQIFTGSAFRYAREFELSEREREELGKLVYVDACVMKSWDKYGVHIVDPALKLIGPQGGVARSFASGSGGSGRTLSVEWSSGLRGTFTATGNAATPVTIRLFGENGVKTMTFSDTFHAFRAALQAFVDIARGVAEPQDRDKTLAVVELLELGMPTAAAGVGASSRKKGAE